MLAAQLASAVAVVWGICVPKGVFRNKTGHEDENTVAAPSAWAEQDRLLHLGPDGNELPCCGALAPVRCGGWNGVWLVRSRVLQHQATPLVQVDAPSLGAYPGLPSQFCGAWKLGWCCTALHTYK